MIWLQTNGQFISEWIRRNPILVSIMGAPIAYIFIIATKYAQMYFGNLWGGRMLGFSAGILTFSILTWALVGEGLSTKTLLTIGLAFCIIGIQIFWK